MKWALLSALFLTLGGLGCAPNQLSSSEQVTPVSQPVTPIAARSARWDAHPQGPTWTATTNAALNTVGVDLLTSIPRDIAAYCPAYSTAGPDDRRAFWVGLLSILARFESSFRPELLFHESFNDAQGKPVISRGLLQISQESANSSRYRCEITDAQQLHDPQTNLTCGIRITNALVNRDGVIAASTPSGQGTTWHGMAAYWSPFRNAERRSEIAGWTSSQPYCRPTG